ncbi:MAG: sugar-binding domain-containing protein, partial [Kiritimatiellia bacterium]
YGYARDWFAADMPADGWSEIRIGDFWVKFLDEMYVGVGWYRLDFDVPEIYDYDALALHFGGADEQAWVWINGSYAGQHDIGPDGWDKPFQIDVTGLVEPGGINKIAVRVRNTRSNGGIWKPVELRVFRKRF